MDPYALPCHDQFRIDAADRDWRAVGVRTDDGVRRKSTRCPECKVSYTAYERTFPTSHTVEWLQSVPFRLTAAPVADGPVWQDLRSSAGDPGDPGDPGDREPHERDSLEALQSQTEGRPQWERSVQLVTVVAPVTAGGAVFAVPGEVLLERREKWNAHDRRLALLWSPRLEREVVAWHSFARLPQE